MHEAFKYWSDVSSLTFREVNPSSQADMSIKFGRRNHGDTYPFDGPGGVLAHAFFQKAERFILMRMNIIQMEFKMESI